MERTFEQRLRAWLLAHRIAPLARKLGCTREYLYRMLRGQTVPEGLVRWALEQAITAWEQAGAAVSPRGRARRA